MSKRETELTTDQLLAKTGEVRYQVGDTVRVKQRGWHRWTKEEHRFLVSKYMKHGDMEIAKWMNRQFPKEYPWTLKHIEKRRNYFGLSRGRKSGECFNNRCNLKKTWDTRCRAKIGEIRIWEGRKYIKRKSGFVLYYRDLLGAKKGQVARHHEGKPRLISAGENAVMNRKAWMNYSPDLKATVKVLNQLKKTLNGKEHSRPQRNPV